VLPQLQLTAVVTDQTVNLLLYDYAVANIVPEKTVAERAATV